MPSDADLRATESWWGSLPWQGRVLLTVPSAAMAAFLTWTMAVNIQGNLEGVRRELQQHDLQRAADMQALTVELAELRRINQRQMDVLISLVRQQCATNANTSADRARCLEVGR